MLEAWRARGREQQTSMCRLFYSQGSHRLKQPVKFLISALWHAPAVEYSSHSSRLCFRSAAKVQSQLRVILPNLRHLHQVAETDEDDEAKGLPEGWSSAAPKVQWPSLLIWPIFQHPSHVSLQAVKLHMLQQLRAISPLLHWLRRRVPNCHPSGKNHHEKSLPWMSNVTHCLKYERAPHPSMSAQSCAHMSWEYDSNRSLPLAASSSQQWYLGAARLWYIQMKRRHKLQSNMRPKATNSTQK